MRPYVLDVLKHLKKKKNKLTCSCIDNKLLEKYKTIWTNIGDLKNIKLNFLSVYDNRYIKTKRRTYGDKVYTNFRGLHVPEVCVKSADTQMKDYLDDTRSESDKN